MTATTSSLLPALLFLSAGSLGAQPAAVTRPAPPLRPTPVGPAHEIVIYRDRNYDGPAVSVSRDESNLGLSWTVNSARVRSGTWQLCERANYHGSCMTLSSNSSNLGHRRVQSARVTRSDLGIGWSSLGRADVNRLGWIHRTIEISGRPTMSQLRLCAENARIRLHEARVRFTNNLTQSLHVPSQLESGKCTNSLLLTGARRSLRSVDVTAASVGIARGRIRVEGR